MDACTFQPVQPLTPIHIICLRSAGVGHITYSIRLGLELARSRYWRNGFLCCSSSYIFIPIGVFSLSSFLQCVSLTLVVIPKAHRWIDGVSLLWCGLLSPHTHLAAPSVASSVIGTRISATMYFALFREQIALNRIEFVGGHRFRKKTL